jgi:hydrogenase maturation protein HypF
MIFDFPHKKNIVILALGAESAGNFSIFHAGKLYLSQDFGDLLEEKNWDAFRKEILKHLKENEIKPKIILTDLHPLYKTTTWGEKLAKKFSAKFIQVQHHHAHIFSAIGDKILHNTSYLLPTTFYGITMDGTGLGTDGKIWGGEVFKVESIKHKVESVKRVGHLENQVMIGGDLAVREPARIVLSILNKFMDKISIYQYMEKFYTSNQFELIYNQLQQNFNCLETSSTGRVLDAMSLLLGFCGNVRKYKHEPIDMLEKNSTKSYSDLKPKIAFNKKENNYILDTTYLFNYVIKYLHSRDKCRLAATAQLYVAEGLYKIISKDQGIKIKEQYNVFISGGLANNKIISAFFESKGVCISKNIPPGDAGLSFGQIIYYLSLK